MDKLSNIRLQGIIKNWQSIQEIRCIYIGCPTFKYCKKIYTENKNVISSAEVLIIPIPFSPILRLNKDENSNDINGKHKMRKYIFFIPKVKLNHIDQ